METYSVRVADDSLLFSAAHFITLGDGSCESLHGHDYRVAVEVEGPLDDNQCVIDFCLLGRHTAEVLARLDHHTLLPDGNGAIQISAGAEQIEAQIEARFDGRCWQFPKDDCVVLPVANTTSEAIARHVAEELLAHLRASLPPDALPTSIKIELTESPGRTAGCRLSPLL